MKPFRTVLFLLTAAPLIIDASLIPFPIQQATSHLSTRLKRSHEPNSHTPAGQFPKYFKEPDRKGAARHYDHRYEHGVLNDDLRRDAQLHMMRAYLVFFERNGMETWLAHGTLLGWWWNAKVRQRSCLPIPSSHPLTIHTDPPLGCRHRRASLRPHPRLSRCPFQRHNLRLQLPRLQLHRCHPQRPSHPPPIPPGHQPRSREPQLQR